MACKISALALTSYILVLASFFFLSFNLASSSIDQDQAECADQLVGLAPCLPYVGGEAKVPTLDCCSGLKTVVQKSKRCLCILIKDRDDPKLGLDINATLALALPSACHVPANTTECVSLLHLAPNSTDAKVFEAKTNSTKASTAPSQVAPVTGSSSGTSADDKSDGGMGKRWLRADMFCGILTCFFMSFNLIFSVV